MKQEYKWAIVTAFIVAGFASGFYVFNSQEETHKERHAQVSEQHAMELEHVERQRDALQTQLREMHDTGSKNTSLKEEINELKYQAGLTTIKGKGIVIRIEDSKVPLKNGENQNLYLIHDDDILRVLNELRAAGAEAISINNQRVVAMTEVRCTGPTIMINSVHEAPPYVVEAIGDPDTLKAALELRGGVVDTLKHWNIDVEILKSNSIIIPPYKGNIRKGHGTSIVEG